MPHFCPEVEEAVMTIRILRLFQSTNKSIMVFDGEVDISLLTITSRSYQIDGLNLVPNFAVCAKRINKVLNACSLGVGEFLIQRSVFVRNRDHIIESCLSCFHLILAGYSCEFGGKKFPLFISQIGPWVVSIETI